MYRLIREKHSRRMQQSASQNKNMHQLMRATPYIEPAWVNAFRYASLAVVSL